jgi:hypothetical protein
MGISNEDSETQVESEAKDAEENIDDNGTPGNQIRVVALMSSTLAQGSFFQKKSKFAKFFWISVTLI